MSIEKYHNDQLLRGLAFDNQIRWTCVQGDMLCENGCKIHDTDPVSALYFSQALLCSALSIPLMKGDQRTTLRWQYQGALQKILVESDVHGNIRGLLTQPNLMQIVEKEDAIMGESGIISSVVSCENSGAILSTSSSAATLMDVPDDLAMMYCTSNQIETEMITSIHFQADPMHPIACATGIMIQPLPGFDLLHFEEFRKILRSKEIKTMMANKTLSLQDRLHKIFESITGNGTLDAIESTPITYRCFCERNRMIASVKTLAKNDLDHLFESQDELALTCQFCNQIYRIKRDDLS